MKLITEVLEDSVEYITEANEEGEKEYFIEGVFMQANTPNRNGRIYPTDSLEKEVKSCLPKRNLHASCIAKKSNFLYNK